MASTAKRSNLSIVREAYRAFNEGDIETLVLLMDNEIRWIEPDSAPHGGRHRGPDEVREKVFGRLAAQFEEFTVDVDDYMDCGRNVTTVGQLKGTTKSGTPIDLPFAHVMELENGVITHFQSFTDTALWNEAVGA